MTAAYSYKQRKIREIVKLNKKLQAAASSVCAFSRKGVMGMKREAISSIFGSDYFSRLDLSMQRNWSSEMKLFSCKARRKSLKSREKTNILDTSRMKSLESLDISTSCWEKANAVERKGNWCK